MLVKVLINLSAPHLPFHSSQRFWGWDSANYISQIALPVCIQFLPIGGLEGNGKLKKKKKLGEKISPPLPLLSVFDSLATAVAVRAPRLQLLLPSPNQPQVHRGGRCSWVIAPSEHPSKLSGTRPPQLLLFLYLRAVLGRKQFPPVFISVLF